MTFSLHQGGVVMSSQIKHTQSNQDTPFSPYTWRLSLDFQLLRPFYSLSQPYHVTASLPSSGDNHQARKGGPKEHSAKQKWYIFNLIQVHMYQGSPLFAASTVIPLLPKATFTPSIHSLTSVSLVPVLHWLRPSTPFWPYGTHPSFHMPTVPNK